MTDCDLGLLLQVWHDYRLSILALGAVFFLAIGQALRSGTTASPSAPKPALGAEKALIPSSRPDQASAITSVARVKTQPRRIAGRKSPSRANRSSKQDRRSEAIQPLVFFYSLGGSTEAHARSLCAQLRDSCEKLNQQSKQHVVKPPQVLDLSAVEYDDYFTALPKSAELQGHFYLILLPAYNIDTNLVTFIEHLKETHHDFRVDTAPLRDLLGFSVFGFGDKEEWSTEAEGFCTQAIEVDKWMARLSDRKRAYPLGMGDVKDDAMEKLAEWRTGVEDILSDLTDGKGLGEGVAGSGDAVESQDEEEDGEDGEEETEDGNSLMEPRGQKSQPSLTDVENLGMSIESFGDEPAPADLLPIDFTNYNKTTPLAPKPTAKPMVPTTSPTYAALTKQGYSIVGTHSGIKLCRWTKSALRGRGSCYKHSFYGIASHCCMECTPSLSCSNKCVFCWRHGTNPVGTSWRWAIDAPSVIFEGVKREHSRKIRALRGVPGVRAERFEEALRIRHCALSLVGEPIFYPHINEFLGLLHSERISSFLVCNAQHPAQLAALDRVTQLYVSIDAADADALRRIDRPLHRDFWQRFLACLDILREARFRQRTVFRLTLVKGFNIDEAAEGYARLVERGLPCFIEVKGVTYCGTSTSKGAGLTMANVPFYEEVVAFVEALNKALKTRGLEYGIGAEHAHSCCVLLASRRFWIDDAWHTSIDYQRFFYLLESGAEFRPEDYCARTVGWALWGNGGFDPRDVRVGRKGKPVRDVTKDE